MTTQSDRYFQNMQQGEPEGPYAKQRTVADMIRNMTRVDFAPEEAEQHRDALTRANRYMRIADAGRVRRFTGLRSPFSSNSKN